MRRLYGRGALAPLRAVWPPLCLRVVRSAVDEYATNFNSDSTMLDYRIKRSNKKIKEDKE